MSRIKRQVAFPDDEVTVEEENDRVESIGEDDGSVQVVSAADGRALKQIIQSVTKIDVGIQSQLMVAPGSTSIIYFDVTNLRNEPTYHNFNVQDEKRFLRAMEPRL
jgi:exosome complex RNA-binding protein Csl4